MECLKTCITYLFLGGKTMVDKDYGRQRLRSTNTKVDKNEGRRLLWSTNTKVDKQLRVAKNNTGLPV